MKAFTAKTQTDFLMKLSHFTHLTTLAENISLTLMLKSVEVRAVVLFTLFFLYIVQIVNNVVLRKQNYTF